MSVLHHADAPTLFAQAGLSGDSGAFIASGMTGLVLVFATLCGTLYVDKLNRRTIVIWGGASTSFSMLLIGILYATGAAHDRVGKWSVQLPISDAFTSALCGLRGWDSWASGIASPIPDQGCRRSRSPPSP